jgi:hypothetical protein
MPLTEKEPLQIRAFFKETNNRSTVQESPPFMEPECLFSCSQQPYSKLDKSYFWFVYLVSALYS